MVLAAMGTSLGIKKAYACMRRSLYPSAFGRRVRILRDDMKLSQPELAEKVVDQGVSFTQSYLSKLENGEKVPNGEVVMALAAALETTTDFLFFGEDTGSGFAY